MNADKSGQSFQKRPWTLGVLAITLLIIAASVVGIKSSNDATISGKSSSSPEHPAGSGEPLIVRESTGLTVPGIVRTPTHSFQGGAGGAYLLEFEATTEKPEESPGDAMYFGASLACADDAGASLGSVGGTQNVRTGESVTIRNQFLVKVEDAGSVSCRLSVESPSEEAAAEGTSADVDMYWSARRVPGVAVQAPADERLPRVVGAGQRAAVFRIDVEQGAEPVSVLSTVHATACTMRNGSTEDGRTWCEGERIDTQGSDIELTYRADVLDGSGSVCDSQIIATKRASIEWLTHHQILSTEVREWAPASTCGKTVRYVVALTNHGPASVVVHRANSTFLAISESS